MRFAFLIFLSLFSFSCAGVRPALKQAPISVAIPEMPSHFVEIDGAQIHYYEMGEGDPVILMHGMMGSGLSWFQNIPILAREHHVFAFDFPGLGQSELGNFRTDVKDYSRLLKLFIEKKEIKKPSLVGISLGGHVALDYILKYPEEVDKLVLISPTGTTKPISPIGQIAWITLWHQWALQPYLTPQKIKEIWNKQYQYSFAVREALYLKRPELRDPDKFEKYLKVFQTCVYDLKHYSLRNRLDEIEAPTLIIWAMYSKYHPYSQGDSLQKKIKNSRLALLPCGPPVNVDMPEEFNRIVLDFLDKNKNEFVQAQ